MRKLAIILALTVGVVAGCDEVPLGPDTTAPSISVLSPDAGTTATDSLVVRVSASDNRGVAKVELFIQGHADAVAVDSVTPFELVAYLSDIGAGPMNFTAVASDSAGNQASSAATPFTSVVTPGLKFVGRIAVDGSARDVTIVWPYAYVAAWDGGVLVIDIRNPHVPLFVYRFDTDGFAQGVVASGDRLFVADGAEGVISLSIANPRVPVETARIVPSGIQAWQVDVSGNYLYVAGGAAGLYAMDISNPDTIVSSAPYVSGSEVRDVVAYGTRVYTAEVTQGVKVINVANPDSMYMRNQYTLIRAQDLSLHTGFLYVAAGAEGVYTLDVTMPDTLIFGDQYIPGNPIEGVAASAPYTYLAAGTAGAEVINSTSPTNLQSITDGQFNTDGSAYRLTTFSIGSREYVAIADHTYLTILVYIAP